MRSSRLKCGGEVWIDYTAGKFTSQFRYVELMLYDAKSQKFYRKPGLFDVDTVEEFRQENANRGLFTSVWHYNHRDIDRAARLGSLYFDVDSDSLLRAQVETIRLVDYLTNVIPEPGIRVYFTGKKGFHVECEALALGITPTSELPGLFRYIAGELRRLLDLSCLDFSVYDDRRMWRLPNSQHQSTGLYKVELGLRLINSSLAEIEAYATVPHYDEVPAQTFDLTANRWFREWNYEQEARALTLTQRIDRFNKLGTSVLRPALAGELKFDPSNLFKHCHAMGRLWDKAEAEHDLSHEERLFLLSILSYTDEALEYLQAMLAECDDYNPARTQAHIDDWIRRREQGSGGRPFSCEAANAKGVGCLNCHLTPKERVIQVGDHLVPTGEMAQPSPYRYAYRRKDAEPEKIEYYNDNNNYS